jgi:hypothetical protein
MRYLASFRWNRPVKGAIASHPALTYQTVSNQAIKTPSAPRHNHFFLRISKTAFTPKISMNFLLLRIDGPKLLVA